MNFAFTEEQEELRKTVRSFLEAKSSEAAVREQMDTEAGYDNAVWSQMGEQMGLQGLAIPEEHGGSGYGFVELGIVLEEMGRALLCAPYFSTAVLAANTLIHCGDADAQAAHLPGIAAGQTIATLAFTEPSGKWDEAGITMPATQGADGWTLNGTKMFVLDGHTADLILVAATELLKAMRAWDAARSIKNASAYTRQNETIWPSLCNAWGGGTLVNGPFRNSNSSRASVMFVSNKSANGLSFRWCLGFKMHSQRLSSGCVDFIPPYIERFCRKR